MLRWIPFKFSAFPLSILFFLVTAPTAFIINLYEKKLGLKMLVIYESIEDKLFSPHYFLGSIMFLL
jgi:hypothetical protein